MSDIAHVVSVLGCLHARVSALETRAHGGVTDMVFVGETWPVLHDLAEKYRDPARRRLLGMNGRWGVESATVPGMRGTGVKDGRHWDIEFKEDTGRASAEACFLSGDRCLMWDSGACRSAEDLVRELNAYFTG